jgi:N-acetylmuramoyl-L-alanine amidase CwlA
MKIVESILTKNPCYTTGRKITVKGLMLHSVGCPQPSASVFVKKWNSTEYDRACVHGFIDANDGTIYQTLPWNHRGWHGGGSSNNTHIGVEMCEPDCIKYTDGSSFACSDIARAKAMVKRTYESAVELFAHLCKEFNLDPLADGVIVSHKEGHKRGIASNHGDPEHLWKQLNTGYTMDTFRKTVSDVLKGVSSGNDVVQPKPETVLYRVQVGAYSKKTNADAQLKKVKNAGFTDAFITVVDGKLYRVQVGAFSVKANADAQLEKLKKAGFSGFVTKNGGKTVSPDPEPVKKEIKVGCLVRVKNGAKTYSGGSLADFVYERNHTVKQIDGNRVVITFDGVVVGAVHKDNLIIL